MADVLTLPQKTFAAMQQTLRVRCGLHATLGSTPALDDILTEANEYVYAQLDDGLPMQSTITLVPNTPLIPWLSDDGVQIARGSVQAVWIEQGDSDRVPLPQGITHAMRAFADLRAIPEAYDSRIADGAWSLECWPTPDTAYVLHVDHNRTLGRFTAATDWPSAPYRLVLGYAIAMGKAHYKQADAETVGASFKVMLSKEKFRQKENRRFLPPSCDRRDPRVVRNSDGSFHQVR